MMKVNMHQAKTNLSQLVDRAAAGEEVVIARAGRPVARLAPLLAQAQPRRLGLFQGQTFWMADDFDELPEDMALAFEGEE